MPVMNEVTGRPRKIYPAVYENQVKTRSGD